VARMRLTSRQASDWISNTVVGFLLCPSYHSSFYSFFGRRITLPGRRSKVGAGMRNDVIFFCLEM
jgi:anthranilate phosphoribosyltransferase